MSSVALREFIVYTDNIKFIISVGKPKSLHRSAVTKPNKVFTSGITGHKRPTLRCYNLLIRGNKPSVLYWEFLITDCIQSILSPENLGMPQGRLSFLITGDGSIEVLDNTLTTGSKWEELHTILKLSHSNVQARNFMNLKINSNYCFKIKWPVEESR